MNAEQKKREKRDVNLMVRVTKDEHETIKRCAKFRHMSVSNFLRQEGLEFSRSWRMPGQKRTLPYGSKRDDDEIIKLRMALNRLGVNYNQVARQCNSGTTPASQELAELQGMVSALMHDVERVLDERGRS